MAHAKGVERAGGLLEKLDSVHQYGNAVAAAGGLLGDVGEDHGLAAAGGQNEQHGAVAAAEGIAEPFHGLLLVRTQCWSHGPVD